MNRASQPKGSSRRKEQPPTRRIQRWQLTVAVFGLLSGVALTLLYQWLDERWRSQDDLRRQANISVQLGIQPNRLIESNGGRSAVHYQGWVMVMNSGPATAEQFVVHIYFANPRRIAHRTPILMSEPSGATVAIKKRQAPHYYQIVVQNLMPGDGFALATSFEPHADRARIFDLWQKGMFSQEFKRVFIQSLELTGDSYVNANIEWGY